MSDCPCGGNCPDCECKKDFTVKLVELRPVSKKLKLPPGVDKVVTTTERFIKDDEGK